MLDKLHIKKEHFIAHSFQLSAVSSERVANIPDHHIQMLGMWRSDAYKLYIKSSPVEFVESVSSWFLVILTIFIIGCLLGIYFNTAYLACTLSMLHTLG